MRGKAISSWLFLGALFVLCGVLGVLQYRWIGEVSVAARERMRGSLQASLNRVSQDFNAEITSAARGLLPSATPADPDALAGEVLASFQRNTRVFRRVGVAIPHGESLDLRLGEGDAATQERAAWPKEWEAIHSRIMSRLVPGSPPMMTMADEGLVFEVPVMNGGGGDTPGRQRGGRGRHDRADGAPAQPDFGRREIGWVIFELNLSYLRDTLLPDVLQRDLSSADYEVEVAGRGQAAELIYQSERGAGRIAGKEDATVALLETSLMRGPGFGRGPSFFGRGGDGGGRNRGRGADVGPGFGRWQLYARHKAGSLEAAVSQVRIRNLAVTAGVLLLLIATAGALVRYTRRAQSLAELQMDFVAGVSHELRTPLTVIHTAAYNLRGKTAGNPSQVERYGALIQQESARLKDLVEQVLRYATAASGAAIREREPVSVDSVLDDSLAAGMAEIEAAHGKLERSVEAGLPEILGDPAALKHAIGNLLSNAAKYGLGEDHWIGVSAARAGSDVEIRVSDRGPGIPPDEQEHIFDPFFRGKRAIEDQIHGTGLGLNLVKKIVEAHGGSIQVKSQPEKGTEFIVRLPALTTSALTNGGAA